MVDPLSPKNFDVHYKCLDMFPIRWSEEGTEDQRSEAGILLEIWKTGGLVHTSMSIPEGSSVELEPSGRTVQAQVTGCQPDDHFGFLVSVSINHNQYDNWFPESYSPRYLWNDDQGAEPR